MKWFVIIVAWGSIFFPIKGQSEIIAKATTLNEFEKGLVNWVQTQQGAMLRDLQTYVNINTGTFNHEGITKVRKMLEVEFQSLGFETTLHSGGEVDLLTCQPSQMVFADHLLARRTGTNHQKLLLNGHLDTVFGKDDEFQAMTTEIDGTLKGPGGS